MKKISSYIVVVVAVLMYAASNAHAQSIDLHFSGLRSTRGQVQVKIYTDDKSFEDDRPFKVVRFPKRMVQNGEMTASVNLGPGTYGIALLDDENANGEMEYNIVGMPREGFGFSDFYLTGLRKPRFGQFRFTVSKDQHRKIEMKVRYL